MDLGEEASELDWFGLVIVAARLEGLIPVAGHGVGGERNHRSVPL